MLSNSVTGPIGHAESLQESRTELRVIRYSESTRIVRGKKMSYIVKQAREDDFLRLSLSFGVLACRYHMRSLTQRFADIVTAKCLIYQ